jgi:hypothetical protein
MRARYDQLTTGIKVQPLPIPQQWFEHDAGMLTRQFILKKSKHSIV